MMDTILIGLGLFILGVLVGILGNNWWQSRQRIKETAISQVNPEEKNPQPVEKKPESRHSNKPAVEPSPAQQLPVDMVQTINEILQEMIKTNSAKHVLSVTEEPPVGVAFWVDGKRYADLESVDEESRGLLRKAVAEWERRTSEKR